MPISCRVRRASGALGPSRISDVLIQVAQAALAFLLLSPFVSGRSKAACLDYHTYLREIGSLETEGSPRRVALRAPYAFVAGDFGFEVVDLSDPAAPTTVASLNLPGRESDIALAGSCAYIAMGTSGFAVIDVSDPESPIPLGSVDTPGNVYEVAAAGAYAVVATQTRNLLVISAVDPSHPVIVGSVELPGIVLDVDVEGNLAYVADEWPNGLAIVDISNPAAPGIVSTLHTNNLSTSITVREGKVYIGGQLDGPMPYFSIEVVDATDSVHPVRLGGIATPQRVVDCVVEQGLAYLAEFSPFGTSYPKFQVVDVSNPTNLRVLAEGPNGWADGLAVDGDRLVLADTFGKLSIVDVSRAYPQLGVADTPGQAQDVAARGTWAHVADGAAGLATLDVSDPAHPIVVSEVATPGPAIGVGASASLVVVACGAEGLAVYDRADPAVPVLVGTLDNGGLFRRLVIQGDLVYAVDSSGFLWIVSIADPAHPQPVGNVGVPSPAYGVALDGSYAYVANNRGLHIVDVSTPAAPVIRGSVNIDSQLAVAKSGNHAFTANDRGDLSIIDVGDPSAPELVTRDASSFGAPGCVALEDGVAFVGQGFYPDGRVRVVDVSQPSLPVRHGLFASQGPVSSIEIAGEALIQACGDAGIQVAWGLCTSTDVPVDPIPPSDGRPIRVFPNPATDALRVTIDPPLPGRTVVEVVDATGRVVRTLLDRANAGAPLDIAWDGRSDRGARVASGVFWVRVRSDRTSSVARVTLLR